MNFFIKKHKKLIFFLLGFVMLSGIFFTGRYILADWTAPADNPPLGNIFLSFFSSPAEDDLNMNDFDITHVNKISDVSDERSWLYFSSETNSTSTLHAAGMGFSSRSVDAGSAGMDFYTYSKKESSRIDFDIDSIDDRARMDVDITSEYEDAEMDIDIESRNNEQAEFTMDIKAEDNNAEMELNIISDHDNAILDIDVDANNNYQGKFSLNVKGDDNSYLKMDCDGDINIDADERLTLSGGSCSGECAGDIAESIDSFGDLKAGDLVEYEEGKAVKSKKAYSRQVIGVVSTNPTVILHDLGYFENGVPLALSGIVPLKVSGENGEIEVGDMLTSASKPGYAMKCSDAQKCFGAVVGKALEEFDGEKGVINVIVSLN